YYHRWFRSRTPVLALNGDLDPQTPHTLAETIIPHLKGPGQNYVQVRFSPHGVLFSSPVRTPAEPTCGMQIMESFVRNPTKIPDTACLSDLLPVTFAVSAPEAMFFFGQGDIWENPARVSALAMRSLAVPNAADLLDRLRSTDPIERENRIRQLMATED
ncbi:MAG: hypothetical protein HKP58_19785, partial [Desulfatitalea sp.]|nr:hypothetical protein [Desulfatitalea sp.]NNK02659.1 hypothetical protein [Desulfatitalea sp.]